MLTPTSFPKFDPAQPVPHATLADVWATGVGQADTGRLWLVTAVGCAVPLGIVAFAPERWLTAMPLLALGAFGAHGLATQKLYDLRVRSRIAPLLERVLRVLRATATVVGSLAGMVWVLGLMLDGLDVVR